MTLREYLDTHSLSLAAFGKSIGVKAQSVHRYVNGRVPRGPVMIRIFKVTDGKVSPNDFEGVSHAPGAAE